MVACEGNTRHLAEEWNLLSLFPPVSCEFQSNVRLGEVSEGGSNVERVKGLRMKG